MFLYGFDKHDQENISPKEKTALHKQGDNYMAYRDDDMSKLVQNGLIIEVMYHEQDPSKRP